MEQKKEYQLEDILQGLNKSLNYGSKLVFQRKNLNLVESSAYLRSVYEMYQDTIWYKILLNDKSHKLGKLNFKYEHVKRHLKVILLKYSRYDKQWLDDMDYS